MRLVRSISLQSNLDEESGDTESESQPVRCLFFVRSRYADDDGSTTADQSQALSEHQNRAAQMARRIGARVGIDEGLVAAIESAAKWHDQGKDREVWQRGIGNPRPKPPLAKTNKKGLIEGLSHYRHEFGSLVEVSDEPELRGARPDTRDLILHLIATHHGRGRPHFPGEEAFDPERATESRAQEITAEVPRRYARLQRKYGRWGLAYLESLLRAADALASETVRKGGNE